MSDPQDNREENNLLENEDEGDINALSPKEEKEDRKLKMNSIKEILATAKSDYENQLENYMHPIYKYKSKRDIYYYIILLAVIMFGVLSIGIGSFYFTSPILSLVGVFLALFTLSTLLYYTPKEISLWKNHLEISFFLFHSKKISYSAIERCEIENDFNVLGTFFYCSSISGGVVVYTADNCCSSFVLSPSNPAEFVDNVNKLRSSFYIGKRQSRVLPYLE